MKLAFSLEAEQDIESIDAWWRENRPDAPRLFAEELALSMQRNPAKAPSLEAKAKTQRNPQCGRGVRDLAAFGPHQPGLFSSRDELPGPPSAVSSAAARSPKGEDGRLEETARAQGA